MAKKKKDLGVTHIAFILDCSGSMESMRREAVDGFNEQVKTIKTTFKNLPVKVSLVLFSSAPEVKFMEKDLAELKEITHEDYKCGGMTALYDAIGNTILELQKAPDAGQADTAFLLIAVTDGDENNSQEFPKYSDKLSNLIKKVEGTGKWTVTLMGSGRDLKAVAKSVNISANNVTQYQNTSADYTDSSKRVSKSLENYSGMRSKGITRTTDFHTPDK